MPFAKEDPGKTGARVPPHEADWTLQGASHKPTWHTSLAGSSPVKSLLSESGRRGGALLYPGRSGWKKGLEPCPPLCQHLCGAPQTTSADAMGLRALGVRVGTAGSEGGTSWPTVACPRG